MSNAKCNLSNLGLKMIEMPFDCEFSKCLILLQQLRNDDDP